MASTRRKHPRGPSGTAPARALNQLTVSAARLAQLRRICLGLPQTSEKVAWGDPTWRVRDKIFAMQKGNVAGTRPSLWLKAQDGVQQMLVSGDPVRFFVPPYVGKDGWIGVYLDGRSLDLSMLAHLIEESYGLIAPKRSRRKRGE